MAATSFEGAVKLLGNTRQVGREDVWVTVDIPSEFGDASELECRAGTGRERVLVVVLHPDQWWWLGAHGRIPSWRSFSSRAFR